MADRVLCNIIRIDVDPAVWNFARFRGAAEASIAKSKEEITGISAALQGQPHDIALCNGTSLSGPFVMRVAIHDKQQNLLLSLVPENESAEPASITHVRIQQLRQNIEAIKRGENRNDQVLWGMTMVTKGPTRELCLLAHAALPSATTQP